MDENDAAESHANGRTRRDLLKESAGAGVVSAAAPSLSAAAQANTERPFSTLKPSERTIAETLAGYALALQYEHLPPEVARTAKRTILDTIGCAIGGQDAEPSRIALKLASAVTAKPGTRILCSDVKSSPDLAAFANGVMIRFLDFNDGYIALESGGHPSDMIAALLPAAELHGRNGRDLITATVLAHEVFCKVMDVLEIRRLGLDHSTLTGLSAVIAAGKLMGLTQRQLVHAIGITVGGNTAINQGRVGTLSQWKSYASAEACRKALFSAQLAKAGMTGPQQVFEGRDGFFNVISRKQFALPKLGGGEAPFGIMRAFTKRFPLGQYSQTVAQAAIEARRYFENSGEIQDVNIRVSRSAIKVMADSPDKWRPQTHETADHSMPYSAGVALMYGTIEARYYEDPYLHDPRLLDLVGRVKCIPSEEADKHEREYNLCDLELVLKSGERQNVRVEYHRGHFKNPMSDAEMEEKFRSLARDHLPAERTDNLLRQLWALESVSNIGSVVDLTRPA